MFGVALAAYVKDLLSTYNLLDKIITYVKDKGGNLSTLAKAFISIFSYGPLGLVVPWQDCVLAMLSSKHANMHVMILKFLLVLGRLV
jgi:hypothetical protein